MSKRSRRSLRRKSSHDTLRPAKTRIELVPPATDPPQISRAEQIIAKVSTPPPSTSNGDYILPILAVTKSSLPWNLQLPIEEAPELELSPQTSAQDSVEGLRSPTRASPQKNAIVDSIPMRTSSLRQHSSSPAPGKKRERKSKRQPDESHKPESKVDSVMETPPAKIIPESTWADLGEDDGTVKRIRELQEQRKSRLMEHSTPSTQEDYINTPQANHTMQPSVSPGPMAGPRSEDFKRAARVRLKANRTSTEPPSKAHKLLGITDDSPAPSVNGQHINGGRAASISPEFARRQNLSLDDTKFLLRPTTSNSSPTPPLSLDYSYAQAVDALHGIQREVTREVKEDGSPILESPVDEPPLRKPIQLPRTETTLSETQSVNTTPARQTSQKHTRRRLEKRWTTHPDLPLDFDKKSRRKSTSDARHTRPVDN